MGKTGNPPRYVFDLDGTLVDGFEDLRSAVNHTLGRLGGRALDLAEVRERVGAGARNLIGRACETAGIPDAADEAFLVFRAAYRARCCAATRSYPAIPATLAAFGPSRAAVLTNKPRDFTLRILRELGLLAHVGPVVGGDSLPVRKPDPTTLRFVARLWNAEFADLVMVGDSVIDVAVAHAAGIPVIGVSWGLDGRDALARAGADRIIDHPGEL